MSTITPSSSSYYLTPPTASPSSSPLSSTELDSISPEEKGLQNLFFKIRQEKALKNSPEEKAPVENLAYPRKGKRLFVDIEENSAQLLPNTSPKLEGEKSPLIPEISLLESPYVDLDQTVNTPVSFSAKPLPIFPSHSRAVIFSSPHPPQTPRKNVTPDSPFSKILNDAKQLRIATKEGIIFLKLIGSGSYMNVYTPSANYQLTPLKKNEDVVIKLYHGKKTGLSTDALKQYMQTSLLHYHQMRSHDIPTAALYNETTALSDCFFIQEKIPYPIDIVKHIEPVLNFFKLSLIHKIPLDLLTDNFRLKEDGAPVLIDYVEDASEGYELFLEHALYEVCLAFTRATFHQKEKAQNLLALIEEKLPHISAVIPSCRWKTVLEKTIGDDLTHYEAD